MSANDSTADDVQQSNLPLTLEDRSNTNPESGNVETTPPTRLTEDDIGVTLDYEFPPDSFYYNNASGDGDAASHASRERRTHRHRSYLRQFHRSNRRRRENESIVHFYSRHWFGQCVAAFLTGIIFLSIGIVFLTTDYSSDYVGIMFILVSLPSFFMTIHMIRTRIRQKRLERIYRERRRRRATRRRRADTEDSAYRGTPLPFADLPPSYDNLRFRGDEFDVANDPDILSLSTATDVTDRPPPNYDEDWNKNSQEEMNEGLKLEAIANLEENNVKRLASREKTQSRPEAHISSQNPRLESEISSQDPSCSLAELHTLEPLP